MVRLGFVAALALAGLGATPSPASAHFLFRDWCAPYGGGFGYAGPWGVPYCPPYFVPQYFVVPQFHAVPIQPPMVVPHAQSPVAPKVKPSGQPRSDAPPRSAPTVTVVPGNMPAVKPQADPQVKPATNVAAPSPTPAPMSPLTIPDPMVPKSPPLVLPEPPAAKPMAAPADNGALPPITLPEPRKVPNGVDGKEELPPLVLPPDGTGTSSGVIPPITLPPTIAKSSPLAGGVKVQVFAASGAAVGTLRKVGFFNHTDRDLELVIEGKTVTLPKKSYLHAELPAKFTWKAAGSAANATSVPDGAAGVDVLFN
jgi:hypothetical protein